MRATETALLAVFSVIVLSVVAYFLPTENPQLFIAGLR